MANPLVKFSGTMPVCFDSQQQFDEWKYWARLSLENLHRAGPCTDCTPEFQQKMIACGRCENPYVEFKMFPVKMWGKHIGDEQRGFVNIQYAYQKHE